MNLYAYVRNDPVNLVDPLGLTAQDAPEEDCAGGQYCGSYYVTGTRPQGPGWVAMGSTGIASNERGAGQQQEPQSKSKACQILRDNSESTKGILRGDLTGNKNWDNPSTLRGYQAFYQSNVNQWQPLTSTTAKVIIGVASVIAGATPVGRATSISLRVGTARYGAAGAGNVLLNAHIASQLKLNQDRVNAIQQRLNYLKSGC